MLVFLGVIYNRYLCAGLTQEVLGGRWIPKDWQIKEINQDCWIKCGKYSWYVAEDQEIPQPIKTISQGSHLNE